MTATSQNALRQIAERLDALPANAQAQFLRQLAERGIDYGQLPIVAAVEGQEPPLSAAQQRLWFLWQWAPLSPAYNIPCALRLRGRLDREGVQRALDGLVARQAALRYRFPSVDGQPRVCIDPVTSVAVDELDLRALVGPARESHTRALVTLRSQQPFDLAAGPLLRVSLLQLAEDDHVLLLVLHHIVADGWSLNILVNEFAALYRQALGDPSVSLPVLAVQYADYSRWQQRLLAAGARERQLAWWRTRLGDEQPVLDLPLDYPRRAEPSGAGGQVSWPLPVALVAELQRLAQRQGASLFHVLLAAFKVLLYRHSGQRQIRVGVPIANRHREEIHGLVGLFVNTQVLPSQLADEQTFSQLLATLRDTALAAQAHQDLPFEVLVDALAPERDPSRTPLFQVMFNHQPRAFAALATLPGLVVEPFAAEERSARFDLCLDTEAYADGRVRACLTYDRELFAAPRIQTLAEQYTRVLEQVVRAPETPLVAFALLTPAQRDTVLAHGQGAVQPVAEASLPRLFEAQVRRTPAACAVTGAGQALSYAELNAQANQLARHLRSLGAGPEMRVAVALPRTPAMLVALLGVLKSGAAYVPLDPEYPAARLRLMLDDSAARWLITERALVAPFEDGPAQKLCLDEWVEPLAELDSTDLPPGNEHAKQLAYCIYTSGSTGTPKGVAVSHGALVNFLASMAEAPGLTVEDRVLGLTSLSFDIAALELYLPLLRGARVVLADRDSARDPQALCTLIERESITLAQATPSSWRMLLDGGRPEVLRGLKLLTGGEALPVDLAQRLLELTPSLWNLYGPTETTIWSTRRALSRTAPEPLLGAPLANTQLRVLDARLEPVPQGVAGELYIGGAGLAQGYWQRPGLTAERFVADPFGEEGARLYRTGDLARFDDQGMLVYLGRADQQVKLRGHRIEPGEIEACLQACEGVREAAVVVREGDQGPQLVAYLVAPGNDETAWLHWREQLAARLPAHLIPAQANLLVAMPRTANGKLDRKALPAPAPAPAAVGVQRLHRAPLSSAERALAQVWQDLLKTSPVGLDDSFFALGGDSISVIQLVSRAREAGWAIEPRQVFQHPRLDSLAAQASPVRSYEATPLAPFALAGAELRPGAEFEDAYPLAPLQEGLLFHARQAQGQDVYVNQLQVDVRGLDEVRFSAAWQAVTELHPGLRAQFSSAGERPLQWIRRRLKAPVILREDPGTEQLAGLAQEEREQGFDLARGPLWRVLLVRLGEGRHRLICTWHHILLDGWSLAQLFDEVLRHYAGQTLAPLAANAQPQQFLAWLQAQDAQAAETFWRQQLAELQQPTRLASAWSRPAEGQEPCGHSALILEAAQTGRLLDFARQLGVTLNTLVQGAWALLLQRLTGQACVAFGSTVAGRPPQLPGIERQLGLFINTVPLVTRAVPELSVAQWLQRIQAQGLAVRDHSHTPLAHIQQWSGQGGALFDSVLVFENYPLGDALAQGQAGGLSFGPVQSDERSHYAFTLIVLPGERLRLSAKYAAAEFTDATAEAVLSALEQVLLGFAGNAGAALGSLSLLAADAQQEQVVHWNAGSDLPLPLPLQARFEAQAQAHPHAVAVRARDGELSYAELDARANRLARRLRQRGVGPGVRVGVALPRSCALPVGLLAILKAGGTYVPLDPAYPAERLAFMLSDSGAAVLLGSREWPIAVPNGLAVQWYEEDLTALPADPPQPAPLPGSLAYVIYTSGSTGQPKGVAISHANASALVQWALGTFAREDLSAVLAATSVCFDLSVWEFFVTLAAGGTLYLAENALALAELPERNEVRLINTVPSAIAALLAAGQIPCSVKVVNLAGEPLPQRLVDELYALGHIEHVNDLYGPSEDTTYSTWCRRQPQGQPMIGRPLDWTRAYVLDAELHPVPVGVAGELYLAGAKLAQGYLGRPSLTAERFIASPFVAGERLYRTGDVVRYGSAGVLHYIGRLDQQVKIRGFRVELGEIEACLRGHDGVREAAVLAQEGNLVGYLVAPGVDPAALQAALAERLPGHLVPARWVVLEALPQTPSGKLDRKALPVPPPLQEGYQAPQGPLQNRLASLWASLLGVERVGATDDFFALGGHSLLATQLLSRLQRELQVELSLAEVFGCTTVQALAELIERRSPPMDATKMSRARDLMAELEDD